MPSLATTFLAIAVGGANLVLGHGHVFQVISGGRTYPGAQGGGDAVVWNTLVQDEGPVPPPSINAPDIICHVGGQNAPASVAVTAGDTLTLKWIGGIGGFPHPGIHLNYMASCPNGDCASVDKTALKFFKISELGLTQGGPNDVPAYETQRWATTDAHRSVVGEGTEAVDTFEVTIPSGVKPGPYILRHELVALHKANGGIPEPYPNCINLVVSSSGTSLPEGIAATELYSMSDPSLNIDIYNYIESYAIPGPPVASFDGGFAVRSTGGNGDSAPRMKRTRRSRT